jgi:hypothetical protein
MELRQQLAPSREPLPPQRWGFLPTEQFWHLAWFTPITFAFWIPAFIFHDCLVLLGGSWWQNGLACMAFAILWTGLVERWSRGYLARRHMRALTEGELDDAQEAPVLSPALPQKLPVFPTRESGTMRSRGCSAGREASLPRCSISCLSWCSSTSPRSCG